MMQLQYFTSDLNFSGYSRAEISSFESNLIQKTAILSTDGTGWFQRHQSRIELANEKEIENIYLYETHI